jgi:predicted transcriptional regulator
VIIKKNTVITVVPRLIEKYMIKSSRKNSTGIKKNCSFGQIGLVYEPYGFK